MKMLFARKSLEVLIPYIYAPGLRLGPQKDLGSCNVVLGVKGRRGSPESGELARVRGRERAMEGSPLPKGLISGLGRVGERVGEGACRRPAADGGGRREPCCGVAAARTGQGGPRVAVLGGHG
jgi:hypothetical protein